jgi:hypothetical protein
VDQQPQLRLLPDADGSGEPASVPAVWRRHLGLVSLWAFILQPGTQYEAKVQGCLGGGWQSYCSQWATVKVTTERLPPPPAVAPRNLHTTANGCCELDVSWTNPPGAGQPAYTRIPAWTAASPARVALPSQTGFGDVGVIPGETYTYQVCLPYASGGSACGTTSGATKPGGPPPVQPSNCQLVFSCPQAVYTPPDYTLTCPSQADFYSQSPLTGAMTFLSTGLKLTGTSSEQGGIIRACNPNTTWCSEYSIYRSVQEWCAPPPPAPPPGGPVGGCGG